MLSDIILSYCLSVIALASIPGVAVTNLTFKCYNFGRQAAFNMAFGIALARFSIICILLAGFQLIVFALEAASDWLKIGAALYLIWFGYCLFRRTGAGRAAAKLSVGMRNQVMSGFMVTWCNPKALLFAVVILPQFIDPKIVTVFQTLTLGLIWVGITFLIEAIYIMATVWICAHTKTQGRSLRAIPATALVCYGSWLVLVEVIPS